MVETGEISCLVSRSCCDPPAATYALGCPRSPQVFWWLLVELENTQEWMAEKLGGYIAYVSLEDSFANSIHCPRRAQTHPLRLALVESSSRS